MGEADGFLGKFQKTLPAHIQLPELYIDSITTEENNPTQEQKDGGHQMPPAINFSDSAQEMKNRSNTSAKTSDGARNGPTIE